MKKFMKLWVRAQKGLGLRRSIKNYIDVFLKNTCKYKESHHIKNQ
jgi:hypothetical protein